MTIDSWIERTASKSPDKTAIIFDGLQLSYGQMMNAVNSYISLLNARGIGKGDRLAYLGLNDPVIFILLFACAKIGAIFVPVNWRLSETEIGEILENCQPELLIYDKGFSELAEKFKSCPSALKCALEQELGKSTQQPVFDAANICLEDPLLLVYTSGSTGRPKGVILSQRAVCANAEMSIEAHKICAEDTVLCVLPLFHVGGMNILATPAFYMGATVILQAVFDPQTCLAACQRAQLIITVPTILKRMTEHENWEQTNLDQMRVISIGSTDVPV